NQGRPVRLGRRRPSLLFEPRQDEVVDTVADPGLVLDGGEGWTHRLDISPVLLVLRALVDPRPEVCDLIGSQWLALGRHALGLLAGRHTFDEAALRGLAGDDGRAALAAWGKGGLARLQVKACLLQVGAVTLEAAVGQDRPDVTVEADLRFRSER